MTSITVYGAKRCSYCEKLEDWLIENKLDYDFKNIDIAKNQEELMRYEVQGIPFIIIKDNNKKHIIEGFNPDQIKIVLYN